MNDPERFDAVIIGTGQAGKPLAGALAGAGKKTAIVERDRVGGTCILTGCTPTKTMVASARVAHLTRRGGDFGVVTGPVSVEMEEVRRRKRRLVDSWSSGNRKQLEETDGVELIFGEASFTGPRALEVKLADGGGRRLSAEWIFVNTGARPRIPELPGLDQVPYLNSTSIMELGEVPEHLMILGGGFVGLEFGQMFRRFGSRVSILEQGPHLAPREDPDVCRAIQEILAEDGIQLHFQVLATSVTSAGEGIRIQFEREGDEGTLLRRLQDRPGQPPEGEEGQPVRADPSLHALHRPGVGTGGDHRDPGPGGGSPGPSGQAPHGTGRPGLGAGRDPGFHQGRGGRRNGPDSGGRGPWARGGRAGSPLPGGHDGRSPLPGPPGGGLRPSHLGRVPEQPLRLTGGLSRPRLEERLALHHRGAGMVS